MATTAVNYLLKTVTRAWQRVFSHAGKTVTVSLGVDFALGAAGYLMPVILTRSPGITVEIASDIFLRQIAGKAVDTHVVVHHRV